MKSTLGPTAHASRSFPCQLAGLFRVWLVVSGVTRCKQAQEGCTRKQQCQRHPFVIWGRMSPHHQGLLSSPLGPSQLTPQQCLRSLWKDYGLAALRRTLKPTVSPGTLRTSPQREPQTTANLCFQSPVSH